MPVCEHLAKTREAIARFEDRTEYYYEQLNEDAKWLRTLERVVLIVLNYLMKQRGGLTSDEFV